MSSGNNADYGWQLVESDPALFTEMATSLGVKNVQFEEVYTLDPSDFQSISQDFQYVYGLIFLFRHHPALYETSSVPPLIDETNQVFFARQIVNNACATQAILSLLLNNQCLELGELLSEFKAFTHDFPPDLKGQSIGLKTEIRQIHNALKSPSSILVSEGLNSKSDQDAFHYVALFPHPNKDSRQVLWVDGLRESPLVVGEVPASAAETKYGHEWCVTCLPSIQTMINQLQTIPSNEMGGNPQGGDHRFSLIVMVPDRLELEKQRLAYRLLIMYQIGIRLEQCTGTPQVESSFRTPAGILELFETSTKLKLDTVEQMAEYSAKVQEQDLKLHIVMSQSVDDPLLSENDLLRMFSYYNTLQMTSLNTIQREIHKRQDAVKDAALRKHDWVPSVLCLVKMLAKSKSLSAFYNDEIEKKKQNV